MNPTELQPSELMQIAANFFESEDIHYRVVGSMASMPYYSGFNSTSFILRQD